MRSRYCILCKNQVLKNHEVAVIALPLRVTNNHGDYGLIGEFFTRERVVHLECLNNVFPSLRDILYDDAPEYLIDQLHSCLADLGEKISKTYLKKFISENSNTKELPGLITLWFTKRNVFGQKS